MAMTPRDRRALLIFGVVIVVAAAAFFLLPKATKKSPQGGSPIVAPSAAPSASPSAAPRPKSSPKQVLVFSGRDPFDPSQGGGSITPVSTSLPNPSPSSTTPSVAVFVLAELVMLGVRRRREEARRSGPRSCGQTPGHTPLH